MQDGVYHPSMPTNCRTMKVPAAVLLLSFIASAALAQEIRETAGPESGEALEAVTRLQIFLDRAEFAPGKIDGRLGQFTLEALALYRAAHGGETTPDPKGKVKTGQGGVLPELADLDLADLDLAKAEPLFLSYEVVEDDFEHVGDLPSGIPEQAQLKAMPYRSVAEAIAEKFHMDEGYLDELNPGKTENIKAGDLLKVANVVPFEKGALEALEDRGAEDEVEACSDKADASDDTKEVERELLVHINTESNMLTVHEGDKVVAAYPVTVGSGQTESPEGEWTVTGITAMPNFRHDKSMLKKGVRSDNFHILPPGPNNPVGVIWIQLNKEGIGIHGTNDPGTIGRSSSHGCVRLANWDVARLVQRIGIDVPVTIQAGPR